MRRFLKLGLRRPFLAVLVPTFVMTGVFGWQAVESQEVKRALVGRLAPDGASALLANRGDQTLTLEGVGLIDAPGVELVGAVARPAGAVEESELDGFAVAPGAGVELLLGLEPGDGVIGGLRVHYRAGGRAGETVLERG